MNQYSDLKVLYHQNALNSVRQQIPVAPVYIRLKPTNLCNHHCAYCTYGAGKPDNKTVNRDSINRNDIIPWEKMQEIICDIKNMGVKAVTLSGGGEPLTYPKIYELIDSLMNNSIDLSLITNGQLLKGRIAELLYDAKWVRVSFDSPDGKVYTRLRNIPEKYFAEVCSNIRNFALNKAKSCVLGVNFVVNKLNFNLVYEAAEFLKNLGVDNVKFAAVVDNYPNYHNDIKDKVIEQIHRAKENLADGNFSIINNYEQDYDDKKINEKNFNICNICRLSTVIAADCKVYYCHTRAYDSQAVVGDIKNKTFKEMWFSEETQNRLKNLRPKNDCHNFCAYESRNKVIEEFFNIDYNHINFL